MNRGTRIVVLALIALGAVPGVAAAATCPSGSANLAEITVYAPELVRTGTDFTVELEGEAVTADGYANVVVTVGDVRTPVALVGFGEASVTVRAPTHAGQVPVTVTWDQAAGADGVVTSGIPVGACSGSVTEQTLAARWSGAVGNLKLPRVQGPWRLTPAGRKAGNPRLALRVQPTCGIGACHLILRDAGDASPARMRLANGTYRASEVRRVREVCTVDGRDRRGPADSHTLLVLEAVRWRTVGGQLVATRLAGSMTWWTDNTGGAIASCRSTGRQTVRLTAVPG